MEEVREGFLTKQGRIVKNWKRRYFVLFKNGELQYFTSEAVRIVGDLDDGSVLMFCIV